MRGERQEKIAAKPATLPIFRAMGTWVVLIQLASTLFMTGLIWFVQIVHYPLFAAVGRAEFSHYEGLHTVQTGWVVMPVMLTELASAVWLVASPPPNVGRTLPWIGLALLAIVWLATGAFSVPAHSALAAGFVEPAHRSLVATNWMRTLAWTARAGLILWITAGLMR